MQSKKIFEYLGGQAIYVRRRCKKEWLLILSMMALGLAAWKRLVQRSQWSQFIQ